MEPYSYTGNNPIMFTDPTGMSKEGGGDSEGGSWVSKAWNTVKSWFSNNKSVDKNEGNRQISYYFGEGESEFLPDNEAGNTIPVGVTIGGSSLISEIGASLASVAPVIAVLTAAVTLPQGDTRKEDEITLYRGVYVGHPDYANALMGKAVPAGLDGGHNDPESHNVGNFNSVFTSWTMARGVADYHANKGGEPGVVLMKKFKPNETVPSPDNYNELEVLVPGIVRGAEVQRPLSKGNSTAF